MFEYFCKLFNLLPFGWKFARITMTWPDERWMLGTIVLARNKVEFEDGHVLGGATVKRRISSWDYHRLNKNLHPEVALVREPYFLAGAIEDL